MRKKAKKNTKEQKNNLIIKFYTFLQSFYCYLSEAKFKKICKLFKITFFEEEI